jgi:hypothetical protein
VHCVVPAGGLSLARTHWIPSRSRFFLPVKVLSRVFRRQFVAALQRNFRHGKLGFHGNLKPLAHPKAFSAWIRILFRNDWHVYSKRPFGSAEQAVCSLGHYTHRVAISNHRLVSLADDQVAFRWRDSAHNNEHKLMTLALDEFLRRFLLHTLPKGFVRIRHFGFLANRRGFSACQTCSFETSRRSASKRLLALELPPGTSGGAAAHDIPSGKPTAGITVFRCHRCRHLSNHRTYGLLFRQNKLTTARFSLTHKGRPRLIAMLRSL